MKIHHLKARIFSSPEDMEKNRETLKKLLPEDAEINEQLISPELEGGVFTQPLYDLSARLSGKTAEEFLRKILSSLDQYDFSLLSEKKTMFVDDECNLYLRLSRKEAEQGSMVFDSKDPVHITVKLAAYPAKKENALKVLDELIKEAEDERKVR